MIGSNRNRGLVLGAKRRGFTLLIAVILAAVATALGLALSSIAYKSVRLSDTSTDSGAAFYAADTALECGLYADQKNDLFDYIANAGLGTTPATTCAGPNAPQAIGFTVARFSVTVLSYTSVSPSGYSAGWFPTPGNHCARVTVYKDSGGATYLYAEGITNCNTSDPREVERGVFSYY